MARKSIKTSKPKKSRPQTKSETAAFRLSGQITHPDTGRGLAGGRAEVIQTSPDGDKSLGFATTDDRGNYEFTLTADDLQKPQKGSPDLVVRIYSQTGVLLGISETIRIESAELTVDLPVIPDDAARPSEYEKLLAAVTTHAPDLPLADLGRQDIDSLARETGHDQQSIEMLVQSAGLARETGLPVELFYALGRQGMPLSMEGLQAADTGEIQGALETSAGLNLVPVQVQSSIKRLTAQLAQRRADCSLLSEAGALSHVEIPPALSVFLSKQGIRTLADLRKSGSLAKLAHLPVEREVRAVKVLEAHAQLSLLPGSPQSKARLIDAGYVTLAGIADRSRRDFTRSMEGFLEVAEAETVHTAAVVQNRLIHNMITGLRVNGQAIEEAQYAASMEQVFAPVCGCEACRDASSPMAYLADLLDYTLRHLKNNGAAVTLTFLQDRFHQPFRDLPATCAALEKKVRQVRICIEVLRMYLPAPEAAATSQGYLEDAYARLLQAIGTSFDELRYVRALPNGPKRRAIADRLGIQLSSQRTLPNIPDELDRLFLDPDLSSPAAPGWPSKLSEEQLEQLFGLRDTHRGPLDPDVPPEVLSWKLDFLRTRWHTEDRDPDGPLGLSPIIDPDYVGNADLKDATPAPTPRSARPKDTWSALDFLEDRRAWIAVTLTALDQTRRNSGLTPLLNTLQTQVFDPDGNLITVSFTGMEGITVPVLLGLLRQQQRGIDIAPLRQPLRLAQEEFEVLANVAELDQSVGPILDSEWAQFYAIVGRRIKKDAMHPIWRREERRNPLNPTSGVVLGPDEFRIRPAAFASGPLEWAAQGSPASAAARELWESVLRARTEQEQAVITSLKQAVDATEEAVLPRLRDELRIAAGRTGTLGLRTADQLTGYFQIDTQAEGCQITTRVAQAIETLQGLLFGARNGLLEDDALTLEAEAFDEEWIWIGAYAAWRSAMQVFLYPENALRPTLRRVQSQAFKDFLAGCRSFSRHLSAADAEALARSYADYFKDVCSLRFEAVCGSYYPPANELLPERLDLSGAYFLVVARADSGALYYCLQDSPPYWWLASGFRRTVWNPIPSVERGAKIRALLPYFSSGAWFIGLSVEVPQPASESKSYVLKFDGVAWSRAVETRLQALFCSAIIPAGELRSSPARTDGWTGQWTLRSADTTALADVDGDGRKELILIADSSEADGTRRIGLVRAENGGLVLDRIEYLPQGWGLPPGEPVCLRLQLVQSPSRRREALLLVRTAAGRTDFGLAGLRADGVFGLVASTTNGSITDANGQNPWTIEAGVRYLTPDLDGDGYSELVVLGEVFGVTDSFGTTTLLQNVFALRVRETGFTVSSSGATQPVQTWAAPLDSQNYGRSVIVSQRTGRVYPTGALQSPALRTFGSLPLVQRGASRTVAVLLPSAPKPTGFDEIQSADPAVWAFELGDAFQPFEFDVTRAGQELLLTNGSRTDTAIMVLKAEPPVSVPTGTGTPPPLDSPFGLIWRTAGRIEPAGAVVGQTWERKVGDRFIAADLDGDGAQELLVIGPDGRRAAVLGRNSSGALVVRQGFELACEGPIPGSGPEWPMLSGARYLAGDIDGDGGEEILAIASSGPIGVLRGPAPLKSFFALGMKEQLGPASVQALTIIPRTASSWSPDRRDQIRSAYESNTVYSDDPDVFYLDEAYYFVPMELGLRLRESGEYTAALDWLRSVYDYDSREAERTIAYRLVLDAGEPDFQRSLDWLRDPLNPHAIAAVRRNVYNKFTLLALVRCLLDFADAEFTRATSESIPQARELYLKALELLGALALKQHVADCSDLIGRLTLQVGDEEEIWVWYEISQALGRVKDRKELAAAVEKLEKVQLSEADRATRLERARAIAADAVAAAEEEMPTFASVTGEKAEALDTASVVLLSDPAAAEAVARLGASAPPLEPGTARYDMTADEGTGAIDNFWRAGRVQYVPAPSLSFCIPLNPVLASMRGHAELCLHKIRACRNIAGMELNPEPYGALEASQAGTLPLGEDTALPAVRAQKFQPLPYRYNVLIERTRQLVDLARQMESSMLSFLTSADQERYQAIKARQDLVLTQAGVRLKDIQLIQADRGIAGARLQRERAQLQAGHFTSLVEAGWSEHEKLQMANLVIADVHQHAAAISAWIAAFTAPGGANAGGITSAISTSGSAWAMNVQFHALNASLERRAQEWTFQQTIARHDVLAGEQQIRLAQDQLRVVTQERAIAALQVEHAGQMLDFLTIKKFTNLDLYEWMSGAMEQVYRFFLQQATSMAQVAERQLAFERQEIPSTFIRADYWEPPRQGQSTDFSLPGANGPAASTHGLTGSARLLRDVYELDQHAFVKNQRKLQLTETISLAQLDPSAFQRFRQTGVLSFRTPMSLFDRRFPGHYLRLIKRVRTSVIALIPPTLGIRATLSTTGISRTVIGNGAFDTVNVQRGPESLALSSPVYATGLFELDSQPELLVPFEGIGVDAAWEFRMPKAANLFDYDTIADVLFTIDYTALDSFDYRQQVLQSLDRRVEADRPFSFRNDLADQWYDLHNADLLEEPDRMIVRFRTELSDFPPNLEDLSVRHVVLQITGESTALAQIENVNLQLISDLDGAGGGDARPQAGRVSTRAGAWNSLVGKRLAGEWILSLRPAATDPDQVTKLQDLVRLFKADEQRERIQEMHLVITYSGQLPDWSA